MSVDATLLEAVGIGRVDHKTSSRLIDNITLAVGAGDRIALTGPTGSGKTVLLRLLAMLDANDEGEIHWRGSSPSTDQVPTYRSQSIYLPQRASLLDGTVEQNLRLAYSLAANRRRSYESERTTSLLSKLGRSSDFAKRNVADLSGGERQIVALLRGLQLDPTLLLLDEPTASLDDETAQRVEQLVTDWVQTDNTQHAFIWVTHDRTQAKRIANRSLQMLDGALTEQEAAT